MIRIKSDKIVLRDRLFSGFVYIDCGVIVEVTEKAFPCDEEYDFSGEYVMPGLIDAHTHGGGGYAFTDSSESEVAAGCNFHLSRGVTSIVPTVSAGEISAMERAVANIKGVIEKKLTAARVVGAHLEGPYLSKAQCGAQCPSFITPPIKKDYERLIENYGKYIARWTFAPESDDGDFCKSLTQAGIVASVGHSDAKYPEVKRAVDNGASLVTHLYSCTSTVTRDHGFRSLGVTETAFLCDELNAEIIADGKHLPAELVRMIVKVKGENRVVAVTDSLSIAGTKVKSGTMSGTDFIVEDGVCKLKDRSAFAGSVATADRSLSFLVRECGFSVPLAAKMLSYNPARVFKLRKGLIKCGYDADIAVFSTDDFSLKSVFVGGRKIDPIS